MARSYIKSSSDLQLKTPQRAQQSLNANSRHSLGGHGRGAEHPDANNQGCWRHVVNRKRFTSRPINRPWYHLRPFNGEKLWPSQKSRLKKPPSVHANQDADVVRGARYADLRSGTTVAGLTGCCGHTTTASLNWSESYSSHGSRLRHQTITSASSSYMTCVEDKVSNRQPQLKNEISDDDGISSDSERSVTSVKRSKTGPKRVKPQCYGPSSAFWHKGAQSNPTAHTCGELGTLPVKIDEPVRHKADLTRGVSRLRRYFTRPHNRLPLMVDDELTAYLQCEFAFRPRTPELLPQMAGKARQFLARYDCSELTWRRRAEMVVRCVGAAMDITQPEYEVRQHFRDPWQTDERAKQAQLLTTGLVSRGGLLTRSCKLPKITKAA